MLLELCSEMNEIKRKAQGDVSPSEYEKYQKLKAIEPVIDEQYENGEIEEERYKSFKETIANYEKQMR